MIPKSKTFYVALFLLIILPFAPALATQFRHCIRTIDGDTIILDGNEKVRLIGVDTPETVHPSKPVESFGKEASAFTKGMVEGKKARLEYDWQKVDKYGRTLAYVFLEDGTFLNAEIIKQGYGYAYTKFPFKYLDDFRKYEREARENGRGLWKEAPGNAGEYLLAQGEGNKSPPDQTVYITRTGKKYHSGSCRYLSKSKIPISLKAAVDRGYTPCSVCGPPTLEEPVSSPSSSSYSQPTKSQPQEETVYVTKTGSKYHRAGCRYLSRSCIAMNLSSAKSSGYSPCSVCGPPE